jgi:hypothetical protein
VFVAALEAFGEAAGFEAGFFAEFMDDRAGGELRPGTQLSPGRLR